MVNAKAQEHDDSYARFVRDNVRDPEKAIAQMAASDDSAPEKESVTQADLVASAPDPAKEVHGAMHRPVTTRSYPSAALGQVGMPAGFVQASPHQAAKPNSGSAVS